ncbi:hypothetical protein P9990_25920 (plasmid) [Prescottella equi]|uniref:hypothetical protein n=1 Tax=Rhodococcus hoagii TaxID=43767 RepID=UPI0025777ADA|nr:hypothetical protein [Prescottella equi]WJJ14627.1 hypothetical protein P9990_25920 [Prescottella equi]
MATTTDSDEVAFTIVASLSLSIDDINRIAQDRWDNIFFESGCSQRTTQPCILSSSPVPDDSQARAFHFVGTLLA